MYEPGSRRPTMCDPGATRSTCRVLLPVRRRPQRVVVDRWGAASSRSPRRRARTDRAPACPCCRPGRRCSRRCRPRRRRRCPRSRPARPRTRAGRGVGLRRVGAVREADHADVHPVVALCWTTQSIAAITWETSVPPSAVRPSARRSSRPAPCRGTPMAGPRCTAPSGSSPARDQAGHERPVAERVEVAQRGALRLERKVGAVDHLPGRVQARNRRDAVSITATSTPLPV